MKPIYLTEILDEIMGIPEGIVETARNLYENIVKHIEEKYSNSTLRGGGISMEIKNPEGFKISDYSFDTVEVEIEINPTQGDEIDWAGMGFMFAPELKAPYKQFNLSGNGNKVGLGINLIANRNKHTWKDVVEYMSGENKMKLMASLAHELKHAYDKFKKDTQSAVSMVKYKTNTELMQSIPGISQFMYYAYFTTLTENLVRATEVGSYLKYKGTTKKDFLNILKETSVYQNAKEAQAFTFEKMMQLALSDPRTVPSIKDFFMNKFNEDLSDLSDEEVFRKFLKHHFSQMKKHSNYTYKTMVQTSGRNMPMMFSMFGFGQEEVDEERLNAIKQFEKIINKYSDDDYEKFYRNEIARINFNANKIIRKVAKLYDYI